MAKHRKDRTRGSTLEDRFDFLGDAIAPGDIAALKSAMYEVEDRLNGAARTLKLWRKTGTAVDEDLRNLWLHEMRQVQRVMAYAGAREVIVDVLEFVEDAEFFGVVLERVGAPLSVRRRRVSRNHWLNYLGASRPRTLLWRNIRRIATALGLVHAQGLVHGKLSGEVIMTEGSDEPDFQLGGFEWSLWVSADTAERSHAVVSSHGATQRAGTYSFATDWADLAGLVAECLNVKIGPSGDIGPLRAAEGGIVLTVSERTLLKRLAFPTRLDQLDASSITRSIDDIVISIAKATAVHPGTFILGLNATPALGDAIYAISGGAIAVDEFREQLSFVRADLEGGATLIVPREFDPATGTLRLVTETMVYRLRAFREEGSALWDIAVCTEINPRIDALRLGLHDEHSLDQPIAVAAIPREARELRARLGPDVLDWSAFAGGAGQVTSWDRTDVVCKALLLVQIVEAVVKALEIYPLEILSAFYRDGRRYAVIRADPGNDRDRFAKRVGLAESSIALKRLFEEDGREAEGRWRISQSSSLGASQSLDVTATFVDLIEVDGRHGYLFEIDEDLPPAGPFFLRAERDLGSERVIGRRLANIKALDTRVDLTEMLDDPWRVRRLSREEIDLEDARDSILKELDPSKQKALAGLWSVLPSFFVVGPPGVGKTMLATETVRRRFSGDRSTRMLVTAQGHDALDNLQEAISDSLKGNGLEEVIVVRSTTSDQRQTSEAEVHLAGLSYLDGLAKSRLVADAPVALRERVLALKRAGSLMARSKERVSRDERSGLHAVSNLVLDGANIVITTANSPDVERMVEAREQFDWVLVEEAAKATGPELIGAMMLSGRRLLIGDHNQLAPFGVERLAKILGDHALVSAAIALADQMIAPILREGELDSMEKLAAEPDKLKEAAGAALRLLEPFSTFVQEDERRFRENALHRPIVAVLDDQRRMDPAIARVVSEAFYKGRLNTHPERAKRAEAEPAPFVHEKPLPPSPVVVVDFPHISVSGTARQIERGKPRWHNPSEVDAVVQVLRRVRARGGQRKPTLAILSPYNAQVDKLHDRVSGLLKTDLAHLTAFSPVRDGAKFVGTVDSFQGSEADLVVVSLVRNNPGTGVGALGFLRDSRRMNVALSRAKSQLIIVGSLAFLREAVRGVNPDGAEHDLSFLTRMTNTIVNLSNEKRADSELALAAIISPAVLGSSR